MFDAAPLTTLPSSHPGLIVSQALVNYDRLAANCGPVVTFAPGTEIFAEGDKAGALYQVAFGVVRIYRLMIDGRRQICAFYMAGDIFGFECGSERHFFADAVDTVGLRTVRPATVSDLSQELLKLALQSLSRAHDHLLTVGRNNAAGRVAAFLLDMAQRQSARDGRINLPMSRTDIADYLGLTIETVSRVLTRLKDSAVIRMISARQLDLLDLEALKDMKA